MLRLALALILCGSAAAHAADPIRERGQYLVERVGMCSDCHSPRDATGQLVPTTLLHGAPVAMTPLHPMPWAEYAPALAGLPANYTEAQFVTFMQTGARPDGSHPRPPMPPYRMDAQDARAVAAFLKSLQAP